METQKMSLANIKGKLSRAEMKNIMAGSGSCPVASCSVFDGQNTFTGHCGFNIYGCECITNLGPYIPSGQVSHCQV